MKPLVLVTTAAGRTGSAAALELARLGYPVRGLVRRDDHRARHLRDHGIEIVVGNLHDWRDLTRALAGVQRAYHCPPFDPQLVHGANLFALAAEAAGVEVVALLSGWNPHPTHPSIVQRGHWLANNLYRRQTFDVIHINPGVFAFTYFLALPAIIHLGRLPLPFGRGRNAPPSSEDIGRVAAHALADPDRWVGRCLRPTGPTLHDPDEMAAIIGRVLGRKVTYQDATIKQFIKAARAQQFPTFQIAQVRHYATEHRNNVYADVTDHVAAVTGQPPEDFETISRRYLSDPTLIAPNLRHGTRLGAIGFIARTMLTPAIDLDQWESTRDYPTIDNGVLAHDSEEWANARAETRLVLQPDA